MLRLVCLVHGRVRLVWLRDRHDRLHVELCGRMVQLVLRLVLLVVV